MEPSIAAMVVPSLTTHTRRVMGMAMPMSVRGTSRCAAHIGAAPLSSSPFTVAPSAVRTPSGLTAKGVGSEAESEAESESLSRTERVEVVEVEPAVRERLPSAEGSGEASGAVVCVV